MAAPWNNVDFGGKTYVRMDAGSTPGPISGILAPAVAGTPMLIFAAGAGMTFSHNATGDSDAANCLLLIGDGEITLSAGNMIQFVYDGVAERWIHVQTFGRP